MSSTTADTAAPTLISLIIPTMVDLSSGTTGMTVSGVATDDLSGVSSVVVFLDNNLTYSYTRDSNSFSPLAFIGNYGVYDSWADGVSSQTFGIAATNPSGDYSITSVQVKDVQGNVRTYLPTELAAMGVNTTVHLVGTAPSFQTLNGTAGDDLLNGSTGSDLISGFEGNDTFIGGGGTDTFVGGLGIDMALYAVQRDQFQLMKTAPGHWTLQDLRGGEGDDQLVDVERLQFADTKVALDLGANEHATHTLEIIGVLAPTLLHSPGTVGLILGLVDKGMSIQAVLQLAVDIGLVNSLAGSGSNAAVASMAYHNATGNNANAAVTDLLTSYMDGRTANLSQADFLTVIAQMEINQSHIGILGLQQTGIEYA